MVSLDESFRLIPRSKLIDCPDTDDLPVIKENIKRTFLETQSKVNRWVADLKKKIDGEDEPSTQGYNQGRPQQPYGSRRSGELGRRSGERERYDADPQVLGDDLSGLELRDDESEHACCISSGCTFLTLCKNDSSTSSTSTTPRQSESLQNFFTTTEHRFT